MDREDRRVFEKEDDFWSWVWVCLGCGVLVGMFWGGI